MAHFIEEQEDWVTIIWDIENYNYCWDEDICSPEFTVVSDVKTSWKLIILTHAMRSTMETRLSSDIKNTKENFISCVLNGSVASDTESSEFESDLAIVKEDGSAMEIMESDRIFLKEKKWGDYELLVLREDGTMPPRTLFLYRNVLKFRCRLWRKVGETVTPVTLFARTALKVEKRDFCWHIHRFSSLGSDQKDTHVIFSGPNNERLTFKIGVEEDEVVIRIVSLHQDATFIKFRSFILDMNESRIDCGRWEKRLNLDEKEVVYTLPFTKQYLMYNENYVMDDILSLYCEYSWSDGIDINRIERIYYFNYIPSPCAATQVIPETGVSNTAVEQIIDLKEDLQCLYTECTLSDVKLRTTSQTFQAHTVILCARSPVFHAMFTTDMKEKMVKCVDVPDLEDDTVHRMLLYMYTNTLKGLEWESALKLYAAADKYEIVALKRKCSSFLKCRLRPNNVCDVLLLADMHADVDLKMAGQDYAMKHEHEVFRSDEWKVFAKNNPSLAMETMLLKWDAE